MITDQDTMLALSLDPVISDALRDGLAKEQDNGASALEPSQRKDIILALQRAIEQLPDSHTAVILCPADVRRACWILANTKQLDILVLAYDEIPPEIQISHAGMVRLSA
ncbi:MAG: FHIPEP family type III secretion protein [Myxococcales bacterium]|nr:MAG: FHIPEP family type III secretion protein [Myxococcales bacterium]